MKLTDLPIIEANNELWRYLGNDEYRYLLEKVGTNPLVCIGANTSTAVPGDLDPTLSTVDRIAKRWGYDGWIMLNLCPIRATNPKDLPLTQRQELYEENIRWIESIISEYPDVLCSWGNLINQRPYMDIWSDINIPSGVNWLCRGPVSKEGNPHHPLYVRDDAPLYPFDMEKYIQYRNLKL